MCSLRSTTSPSRVLFGLCLWGVCVALSGGADGIAAAPREDWPEFRGHGRDGVSAETGLLATWPDAGPPEVWRIPMGTGFSGMAVVGGRIYTMEGRGEHEYALSLDSDSGREIWRTRIGPLFREYWGDGPRCTPTVDGDRIYVLGANGNLVALEAESGEKLWELDFKEAFGSAVPEWGFTQSPLVVGRRLVVQPGGPDGKSIVALDKTTGEVLWSTWDDAPGYASPILIDSRNLLQIVFLTPAHVVSLTPAGKVLWSVPFAPEEGIKPAIPIFIAPDLVFVSASYDVGALALRFEVEDGSVKVKELWRSRVMKNHFNAAVALGKHLYGFDNATFKCIDAASGEEGWAQRGGFGKGSLVYADGQLIVLTETGTLMLVEASCEAYHNRASAKVLSGRSWTSPTLAGGRLYLRNREEMVCLDLRHKTAEDDS